MPNEVDASQQEIWNKEYEQVQGVATSTRANPSASVRSLLEYLRESELAHGTQAIDLGCGAGRNAVFLAQQGYQVTAIDFAPSAIRMLKARAQSAGVKNSIQALVGSIGSALPLSSPAFDLAIDVTATNSLNVEELPNFAAELARLLNPVESLLAMSWPMMTNSWEAIRAIMALQFSRNQVFGIEQFQGSC